MEHPLNKTSSGEWLSVSLPNRDRQTCPNIPTYLFSDTRVPEAQHFLIFERQKSRNYEVS